MPISAYAATEINVEVICFDQLNRHLLELDSNRLQKAPPLPIRQAVCVRECASVWRQKVNTQQMPKPVTERGTVLTFLWGVIDQKGVLAGFVNDPITLQFICSFPPITCSVKH